MNDLTGKIKTAILIPPQLKDNGAVANNGYVDTAGFRELLVILALGATDTTFGSTTASAALQLEESDNASDWSDIDGAVTADALGALEDSKLFGIHLDMNKAHGRYVRLKAPTAGDGSTGVNVAAFALLGKGEGLIEESATAMGLTELILA